MPILDPHPTRPRPKPRLIPAAGFALLTLVGAIFALQLILRVFVTPWSLNTAELEYLAALPYPDPHPDQSVLLRFHHDGPHVLVTTGWVNLQTSADDARPALAIRFETHLGRGPRRTPTDHALLHVAAWRPARLPRPIYAQTLTLRAGRTISLTHPTAPPFSSGPDRDHAVYRIHPDAILDLIAPHGTPPTLTIGDHHAELTETHLAPLRAFAATLKPGYTPP